MDPVDQIVDLLRHSRSLLFVTGAGISAESGLPTYRGVAGLYDVNTTEDGMPIEELLSGSTFRRNPELTWKYLGMVERACRGAKFNRGHQVIAEMEAHFDRVWTVTQNVDGLHHQAGAKNIIDIHGDLHNLCCTGCSYRRRVEDYSALVLPPRCPECQCFLRPDVVLFGEMLPLEKISGFYEELEKGFDLIFSIGTTSVFNYIAEPVIRARYQGWPTVEINPGETQVSHLVRIKLTMNAAPALDEIWRRYQQAEG